jgi:hypothetical protein
MADDASKPEPRRWLDIRGATWHLSMGRDAIYKAIKNTGLPVHRTPTNRLLFDPEELDEWVRQVGRFAPPADES